MMRRMRGIAVVATVFGGGLALLASAACKDPTGPVGVHAIVTLDAGAFLPGVAFDHVTLVARGGGKQSISCLLPGHDVGFGAELDAGVADAGDPCADSPRTMWSALPTVSTWQLGDNPRRVNIEGFDDGVGVSVTAEARLGGGPVVAHAETAGAASLGTTPLTLDLVPTANAVVCGVALGVTLVGDAGPPTSECNMHTDCLCATARADDSTCIGVANGVTCSDAGATLDPLTVDSTCPTSDVARVLLPAATQRNACLDVGLRAHFYRCVDGVTPCIETSDCAPPAVSILVRKPSTGELIGETSLGCVPPLAFSVPMIVPVTATEFSPTIWVSLATKPSTDPHTCRLDYQLLGATDCALQGR